MERKRLTALAVTFLLFSCARAGEIKTHLWPLPFERPQIEAAEIPILVDVGYWVSIIGRPQITLRQTSQATYTGCTTLPVRCNADVRLDATITPTGAVKGDYSCSMLNWNISAPGGTAVVCAKLENPELPSVRSVRVAVIRVSVTLR
jgi:hypothetical protein